MSTTGFPAADFPDFLSPARFSTEKYLSMIAAGVLGPSDNVELIDGVIIDMSPAGVPHNHFLMQMVRLFSPLVDRFDIGVQSTIPVGEGHVYDPDFMLLKRSESYKTAYPTADDVVLVVEASDSSLQKDLEVKLPVYAKAGFHEYWVADLEKELFLVHRHPLAGIYKDVQTRQAEAMLSLDLVEGFSFPAQKAFG